MGDFLFNIFPNERYIDITLFQYGWERCKPLHSYGPASRNHYLFHFVISGKEQVEKFANAIEESYQESLTREKSDMHVTILRGEELREFMKKRETLQK